MKLEIELDLNKIDYDAINKQIAEKVAALNIKDMYDVDSKIDRKITDLVDKEVDGSYNMYLDRYWSGTTPEGQKLIESMTKTAIENRTRAVLEDIFANCYSEEVMREIMLKMIPQVFASILFSRIESSLFAHEANYYDQTHSMVCGEIDSAFRRVHY